MVDAVRLGRWIASLHGSSPVWAHFTRLIAALGLFIPAMKGKKATCPKWHFGFVGASVLTLQRIIVPSLRRATFIPSVKTNGQIGQRTR